MANPFKVAMRRSRQLKKSKDNNPDSPIPFHLRVNAKWYKLAYIVICVLVLTMVYTTPRTFVYDSNGRMKDTERTALAFVLMFSFFTFLSLQCTDPGYLDIDPAIAGGEVVELLPERRSDTKVHNRRVLQLDMIDLALEDEFDEQDPEVGDDDGSSDGSSSWGDNDVEDDMMVDDVEPDEQLDARLAGIQASAVPVRAKYCRHSGKVVAKYDHFCAILGTCIGERNHFRFWLLLLAHTIAVGHCLRVVHSGFHDTAAFVSTWVSYNSHALAAAIVMWILMLVVGGLFLFHTFLAMANMTSYEFMRASDISYLAGTRDFDLPFSNGLWKNLKQFCTQDSMMKFGKRWTAHVWEVPGAIERDSTDVWTNMWENKYWSCC